ncbi:MAG: GNAT family N-acetyltransferase [Actinomycetota bacterium]|nr:GNAT family N-acetyltransferase [Actinomycetota bacterium]
MVRKIVEVTSDRLDALPDRCRHCRFWELGAPRPIDVEDELDDDALVEKCAWWRSVELDFGTSGRAVRVDAEVAAWCLFGPPEVFARRWAPTPRPSADALFLATVWVERPFRGAGLGPLLLRTVVKEALRRDRRAIEAYGDRRHREAGCLLPATWLLHEGFAVHREHPRYPLLRLDVHSTARWAEPIEQLVEQAFARLGRQVQPEPSPQ